MKQIKLDAILFIFLSIFMFSLALPAILTVFNVPNQSGFLLTMLILILIAIFIKNYFLKIPIYLLIVSSSFYYFQNGTMWLISKRLIFELKEVTSGTVTEYPQLLPHLFLLLSLLILVELQFVSKKVLLIGCSLISYLLLLNIFNDITITVQVLLIMMISLFLKALISSQVINWQSVVLPLGLVSLILCITYMTPTEKLETFFLDKTTTVRNQLSNKGFYLAINERKYGSVSQTGFGEDDSELGGAVQDDHRVQFKAYQDSPHYWRIDSKDYYTGKGWETTTGTRQDVSQSEELVMVENGEMFSSDSEKIKLLFLTSENYVPTMYGKSEIRAINNKKNFIKDMTTNRIDLEGSRLKSQLEIELTPSLERNQIPKDTPGNQLTSEVDYLQLPGNYSPKVTDLANELTKDKHNLMDKVESIELYLKTSPDLRYSKSETVYPHDKQDYVEHFLFESQVGYCDNFSTSMVVMLRSVGIQARWVKGFNTGIVTAREGDLDVYSIRNQDAHSWVEVYFDGFGWIPFEPTPTFIYPTTDKKESVNDNDKLNEVVKETKDSNQVSESSETKETVTEEKEEVKKQKVDSKELATIGKFIGYTLLFIASVSLFVAWRYRLYLNALFVLKYQEKEWDNIYVKVLAKIEQKVYREENMPLIQYASLVEMQYSDYKPYFSDLTELYESHLYGQGASFDDKAKKELLLLVKIVIKNQ
ncbi:MAG: transglutaminase domain-containing protein [Vagococcus sp.]|uniref:transglutaminase-like domain-containing protein n=1 Tax=Vagococcus TaxID=2737 RepID=UPI002FC6DBFD